MTGILTSQQQCTQPADFPVASDPLCASNEYSPDILWSEVTNNSNSNDSSDKTMGPVISAHSINILTLDMMVRTLIHQQKMQEQEGKYKKLRMENDQLFKTIIHKIDQQRNRITQQVKSILCNLEQITSRLSTFLPNNSPRNNSYHCP